MGKTKIEWCDYTINPIIGCKHGCSYCYAKRMNDRLHFVKKWDEPEVKPGWQEKIHRIRKPSIIFMGSMTDLFGEWVSDIVIRIILAFCGAQEEHHFLFLTKNPKRYASFTFPKNCWRGMTVDHNYKKEYWKNIDFISIEPLRQQITYFPVKWVICGGMTPRNVHKNEWVDAIVSDCTARKIPLFLKNNLHYPKKIQEFPKELREGV